MYRPRCWATVLVHGVGSICLSVNITVIMILRTWVLYDQKKAVLLPMLFASLVALAIFITVLVTESRRITIVPNPAPGLLSGCFIHTHRAGAKIPLIATFLLDTTIFLIALWRTWCLCRSGASSPLILRLMRDGSVYYLVNTVVLGGSLLILQLGASGYLIAFQSVLGSRMILSILTFGRQVNVTNGSRATGWLEGFETNASVARPPNTSGMELEDIASRSAESTLV